MKSLRAKVIVTLFIVIIGLSFFRAYQLGEDKKDEPFNDSQEISKDYSFRASMSEEELAELREKWVKGIEEDGAENTYRGIKDAYREYPFVNQHNITHFFGEVLYDTEGYDAISICDEAYKSGCFMGMFSKAIEDMGTGAVEDFYQVCNEQEKGIPACHHGIGHALMRYLGKDSLVEALDICYSLKWNGPLGCGGGVFMEYFFPEWFGSHSPIANPVKLDPQNPHDVCPSLPERYLKACTFRAAEWWSEVYKYKWETPVEYCSNLEEESLRQTCHFALGSTLTETVGYFRQETIDGCNSFGGEEARAYCLAGASWRLLGEDKEEVCQENETCLEAIFNTLE